MNQSVSIGRALSSELHGDIKETLLANPLNEVRSDVSSTQILFRLLAYTPRFESFLRSGHANTSEV